MTDGLEPAHAVALRLVDSAAAKQSKQEKREPAEAPFAAADHRFMDYEWPDEVKVSRYLLGWTYLVLDYIQGGTAAGQKVTYKKLASLVGCHRTTLPAVIAALETAGWIDCHRESTGESIRFKVQRSRLSPVRDRAETLDQLTETTEVRLSTEVRNRTPVRLPETNGRLPETNGRLPETNGRLPETNAGPPQLFNSQLSNCEDS